jgi:hypothetical protein
VSLPETLIERVERHAALRGANFSRTVSALITAGLSVVCGEPVHAAPIGDLLEEILARLEKIGGEGPYDTRAGVWKAKCPADPAHDAFLFKYSDASLDLCCVDLRHTTAEMCAALGFKIHGLDPACLLGHVGNVAVLKPDPIPTNGKASK